MKALILAAGRGSRMGNLTAELPKCLTSVGGKTLLEWQLSALRESGINQIGILTGYLAEKVKVAETIVFHNERWSETNMVATLLCAKEWLNSDTCIVSYADIMYPSETIKKMQFINGDIVIPYYTKWLRLWQHRFANPLEDAETFQIDGEGLLTEIGNRARTIDEIQGQYMGLLKITPRGWKQIESYLVTLSNEECAKLDMTTLLRRLIEKSVAVSTVPIEEPWYEFDSENDLLAYKELSNRADNVFKV